MSKIISLDTLVKEVGKRRTDTLFMEYFLSLVAKANLLDTVIEAISEDADLPAVKEILKEYGQGDENE